MGPGVSAGLWREFLIFFIVIIPNNCVRDKFSHLFAHATAHMCSWMRFIWNFEKTFNEIFQQKYRYTNEKKWLANNSKSNHIALNIRVQRRFMIGIRKNKHF